MSGFRPPDVNIYRPYPDEVPWDLLAATGIHEDELAAVLELNFLRVAKHRGRVAGAYGLRPVTPLCYELVTLIVEEGYRRKGLGRWLAGHAIGLAETKGAREIVCRCGASAGGGAGAAQRFLERLGFVAARPADRFALRLTLTPE